MNKQTDILIIGGAITGACAAKEATENNPQVMLIEEKKEVDNKHVEYITKKRLRQLNIKEYDEAIIDETESFTLISPDKTEVKLDSEHIALPEPGYIMDLNKLNQILIKQAEKSGAIIQYNTKAIKIRYENEKAIVTVKEDEEEYDITASLVIIAEGTKSTITKQINLNYDTKPENMRKITQYKIKSTELPDDNSIRQYYGSFAPGGYAWIYPTREDDIVYIGLSTLLSKTDETEELLNEFINNFLEIEYEILDKKTYELPVNGTTPQRIADNTILTGDVAGFINPLTNMKIEYAIASGTYAGVIASKQYIFGEFDKTSLNQYQMFTDMLVNQDFDRYNETRKFLLLLTDYDLNNMAEELNNGEIYESDIDNVIRGLIENCSKAGLQLKNLYM